MENGVVNGHQPEEPDLGPKRFSAVPHALDIPVGQGDEAEAVEVDLEELQPDPTELCMLLENEEVAGGYWTTIALAYAKAGRVDTAIEIVTKSLDSVGRGNPMDKLPIFNCLCWFYLLKTRDAPRTKLDAKPDSGIKTKDFYLRAATSTLNDASRISPSYIPLHLARGVLSLLRAALISDQTEKQDTLRQAMKCFDDSLKASRGQNMMAYLGRARTLFSLARYGDSLQAYQHVLRHAPNLTDPDPRIGIGCCFWMLGHKDDAHGAWERALELNPQSKIANVLLGLYNLHLSSQLPTTDPKFAGIYKKAMVQYIQEAFKIDNNLPLACASFGSYFLIKKGMSQVETLAKKAVELTDVSSIASDGWYLLARKEHYAEEFSRAGDYYLRADQARGGDEHGYLPAKFGAAQIRLLQGDPDGAKFRLEKIVQKTKSIEAMTLLGALWAEDAFTGRAGSSKEEIISAQKKAIPLLEQVRMAWKDPKRNVQPDPAVLLNLARLYEAESPEKSLQCLEQVEQMELEDLPDDIEIPETEDEVAKVGAMREHLPPQLLNNLACFHYQGDRLLQARELFQAALNACVKLGDRDPDIDTDALVTTISFNLARTYEAENMLDEAKQVYQGLLARHSEYMDAKMRLTYISLRQNPTDDGPKSMSQLYEADSTNPEVRALYGWYLRKAKRKAANIAEDQEQRHYKHTLQGHDKHDRYSLTAMGNLYLTIAREMRRETDQEKDRRHKSYERAIEFFDKALQLDPRNAYAAQGIGIAMIEDKKDFTAGLQIFSKVRETIRDASVYVNLGHAYCEVKQYSRAIEAYDAALAKDRGRDPQILACLGRVWLLKGKQEKSAAAMKTALDFSQRALQAAPDQVHFKFNVAFVQIQTAQLLHSLPESQRTVAEVEEAAAGLEEAIESFIAIAKAPNPPFPRHDIEQRANMGRNTMKRQLERAIQGQREYEEKNAARLQSAREARETEIARREEEKRKAAEEAEAQRRKIAEERAAMQERDRLLAQERAEEARRKEEEQSDSGEKKQRRRDKQGKRKKKGETAESSVDGTDDEQNHASDGPKRSKKKRKLERKSRESNSKYKSSEFVVDSDEEDEPPVEPDEPPTPADEPDMSEREDTPMVDGGDEAVAPAPLRKKAMRVIDDDDDDEDNEDGAPAVAPIDANGSGAMSEDE